MKRTKGGLINKYNLMQKFLNCAKAFIDDVLNKNLKDEKNFLFSFTLGKNEEVIAKLLEEDEKQTEQFVLLSHCLFEPLPIGNEKGIQIHFDNEINDVEKGKKILKDIKDALIQETHRSFDFFEFNDIIEKIDIDRISNIETICLKGKL